MPERKVIAQYSVQIVEETDGKFYAEGAGSVGPLPLIGSVALPPVKQNLGLTDALGLLESAGKHVLDFVEGKKPAP